VALVGRNAETLYETTAAIAAAGGRALALQGDVIDAADVERVTAEAARSLGPVDILVNNAGVGAAGGPLWETDPDEWWWVQEVNLKGPYLMMRAVLPGMVDRGRGRVINVGSYAGISSGAYGAAYATSKAALLRMTDGVAAELAPRGVSAFCISPGFVYTDMTRDLEAHLREVNPDFEGIDPDYIFPAEAAGTLCVRLASGEADRLTGRMIHVRDDLDAMIADADAIVAEDRYALRLNADLGD
jgi:NAD(P)-dependent dehydrogenase (short-subunit alcohol dehydrogenase family)